MLFITDTILRQSNNVQNEICFVGSLYKEPDLYVSYGASIRSKYDFYDKATRFFYDCMDIMYRSFSQTVDENKVNMFMSQDTDRLREYRSYGGYKTIKQWMQLSEPKEIKKYFNTVKKYSLLREYENMGIKVEKILNHRNFEVWDQQDIYRIVRTKVDKINTVINVADDSVELTSNISSQTKSYLSKPDMGVEIPFPILNGMFRGLRLGKALFNGFLSNEGKTRNLMLVASYITLVKGEKFLLLGNEMDEQDLRNCLTVTVINNKEFKQLHGVDLEKPEQEIVLGLYRSDITNEFITRKVYEDGTPAETDEEFESRVYQESSEFRKVMQITEWIDKNTEGKIFFKDMGSDYSDQAIEFEIRKHKMIYDVEYFGYDTMKGFKVDDWQTLKQTATKIKELMKEINSFCWAVFQLTDDTVFTDVFQLSSMNIANAKSIKHVADMLMLGKRIPKEEYRKYQYLPSDCWGEPEPQDLEIDKVYFAIKVDKNRGANKSGIILFEINLDLNTWVEVGLLIRKKQKGL